MTAHFAGGGFQSSWSIPAHLLDLSMSPLILHRSVWTRPTDTSSRAHGQTLAMEVFMEPFSEQQLQSRIRNAHTWTYRIDNNRVPATFAAHAGNSLPADKKA